jgi:hypothetical protein
MDDIDLWVESVTASIFVERDFSLVANDVETCFRTSPNPSCSFTTIAFRHGSFDGCLACVIDVVLRPPLIFFSVASHPCLDVGLDVGDRRRHCVVACR